MSKRLLSRDLEWVERARKDSSDSTSSSSCATNPSEEVSSVPQLQPLSDYLDQLSVPPIKVTKMSAASRSSQDTSLCYVVFSVLIKFMYVMMAAVLCYVALHQQQRHDAAVWIPICMVPAIITLVSVFKMSIVGSLWVKSVLSVYLGSTFCFFIWLSSQTLISIVETYQEGVWDMNPLNYRMGRDAMAVGVCIAWQKFHLVTTREQVRLSALKTNTEPEGASLTLLKRVLFITLIPLGLSAFCYVESVRPALASTSDTLKSIVRR